MHRFWCIAFQDLGAWLLWRHEWVVATVVALVPSVLVSALLLWRADQEHFRHTRSAAM